MNKLLLLLLFTLPALAQNGFKMQNGSMVWERTFPAGTEIRTIIEKQDKLKLLSTEETSFNGKAEAIKNNTGTESVRLKCDANFDFTVTVMPQGYLVRVTNFNFLEKYGPMQLRIVPGSLEKYYVEYGKIRNSPKTQNDLNYVDSFLTGVFTEQPTEQDTAQAIALTAK